MPTTGRRTDWERNKDTRATLVALDICGFSKDPRLASLLEHRGALFIAVDEAPHVAELVELGQVKVQFVGDELRFAFRGNVEFRARKIREFVDAIYQKLTQLGGQTKLKGAILTGDIVWRNFRGCGFFDGPLSVACSDWLGCVGENEVIINEAFRDDLDEGGISTSSFKSRDCHHGEGYLLRQ